MSELALTSANNCHCVPTGIVSLDNVLHGGLPVGSIAVIEHNLVDGAVVKEIKRTLFKQSSLNNQATYHAGTFEKNDDTCRMCGKIELAEVCFKRCFKLDTGFDSANISMLFDDLKSMCNSSVHVPNNSNSILLRILIENANSLIWCDPDQIDAYMIRLRAIVRLSYAVCFMFCPISQNSPEENMHYFADVVLSLDEPSTFDKNPYFSHYAAILTVKKLYCINSVSQRFSNFSRYGVKRKGNKISIEELSMPPLLSEIKKCRIRHNFVIVLFLCECSYEMMKKENALYRVYNAPPDVETYNSRVPYLVDAVIHRSSSRSKSGKIDSNEIIASSTSNKSEIRAICSEKKIDSPEKVDNCSSLSDLKLKENNTVNSSENISKLYDDFKNLEEEYRKLLHKYELSEKQLQYQTKVNDELKNLLVASVGNEFQTKVGLLMEEKVRLVEDVSQYFEQLKKERETQEKLAAQRDVWRSKFLSSCVIVDKLTNVKQSLLNKCEQQYRIVGQLMQDRTFHSSVLFETFSILQDLNAKKNPEWGLVRNTKSLTMDDLVSDCRTLADALHTRLIDRPIIRNNDPSYIYLETEHEQQAKEILSCDIKATFGDQNSDFVDALASIAEREDEMCFSTSNSLIRCCKRCKGAVQYL
ncbi:Golgin-45 [Trichinella pseudospiralis]|uniref:Golgin-45 n=1 Tax=Trichinella pseudospiralis TaxID=6337 RepID=A0A0V1EFT9_TRIPS|nr:Golgin-45 [Trichinella pseudospiralis]KRZ19479.1 Golgin-45 [Trichinella pseudospiralis]